MKIHTCLIISLTITFLFVNCSNRIPKIEEVEFSTERLSRIDTMLNGYINAGKLAGATVLISRNDKIAYFKSYGFNHIKDSIPMQNDCIYGIASMTKLITCVAALILYEQGYFRLNDKLSDYLPEFENMKVYVNEQDKTIIKNAENPILIKHLFSHTSGIKYGTKEYRKAGATFNQTTAGFTEKISTVPLYYEPGSTFHYSYSIDILGYLIEKLSGQTLRDFLKLNIFIPLGMDDTDFYIPEEKQDRMANYYEYRNDSLYIRETYENTRYNKLPIFLSGGGGLVSTAEDYAIFLQMILNYGRYNNKQIICRKTVELIKTNQTENAVIKNHLSNGQGYGLGVALTIDAGKYSELFSDGSIFWYGYKNTYFWVDYKENLFGIIMTQMAPFLYLPYMEKFRILTYQAINN